MDRGAWQATVHGVTKELDTTEHTHTHCISHICICVLYYICISICTDIYQGNTIKMDSIVAIIAKKKKKKDQKNGNWFNLRQGLFIKIIDRIINKLSAIVTVNWESKYNSISKVNMQIYLLKPQKVKVPNKWKEQFLWFSNKKVKLFSRVQLFATLWIVTHQAPLSVGFSRQEYWSGLPFPSPGDLSNPGIEPRSPTLQADALTSEPPGKSTVTVTRRMPSNFFKHNYYWLTLL